MQPWDKTLTDAKIADVITYIRQEWGNKGGPVSAEYRRFAQGTGEPSRFLYRSRLCMRFRKTQSLPAANRPAPNRPRARRQSQ